VSTTRKLVAEPMSSREVVMFQEWDGLSNL
jgi:hypothetical protein